MLQNPNHPINQQAIRAPKPPELLRTASPLAFIFMLRRMHEIDPDNATIMPVRSFLKACDAYWKQAFIRGLCLGITMASLVYCLIILLLR